MFLMPGIQITGSVLIVPENMKLVQPSISNNSESIKNVGYFKMLNILKGP